MREKFICTHFATSLRCKIGSKVRFFARSPPCDFPPQNRPFSSDSAGLGAKTTFFGVFFSSAHEIFLPEISVCAEKISLTGRLSSPIAQISTFAGVEKRKAGVSSPNN